eukprot:XP_001704628.1 Hypothetical protein GL50803_38572 [Giardia lamblia ATCC 50803]
MMGTWNTQISDVILATVQKIAVVWKKILMQELVSLVAVASTASASTRASSLTVLARSAGSPGASGRIHTIRQKKRAMVWVRAMTTARPLGNVVAILEQFSLDQVSAYIENACREITLMTLLRYVITVEHALKPPLVQECAGATTAGTVQTRRPASASSRSASGRTRAFFQKFVMVVGRARRPVTQEHATARPPILRTSLVKMVVCIAAASRQTTSFVAASAPARRPATPTAACVQKTILWSRLIASPQGVSRTGKSATAEESVLVKGPLRSAAADKAGPSTGPSATHRPAFPVERCAGGTATASSPTGACAAAEAATRPSPRGSASAASASSAAPTAP